MRMVIKSRLLCLYAKGSIYRVEVPDEPPDGKEGADRNDIGDGGCGDGPDDEGIESIHGRGHDRGGEAGVHI